MMRSHLPADMHAPVLVTPRVQPQKAGRLLLDPPNDADVDRIDQRAARELSEETVSERQSRHACARWAFSSQRK